MSSSIQQANTFWRIWRFIGIFVLGLFVLLPVLYMILISLTPDTEVGGGKIWPSHITAINYNLMWGTIHLAQNLQNSLLVSICTGLFSTIVALGPAYVLARFRFRGRKPFMLSLITMQTIPGVMLLLPLFVIIVILQDILSIKMVGQYYTIIMTYMTFALPFAAWLLLSYMQSLPVELDEAGLIDGCTRLQVVRYIILPLVVPGMVVTFVFSFLLAWGDVLFASVLTSPETRTLAVGLQAYASTGEGGGDVLWGQLMAASLTSGLPVVVIFLLFQRYIIGGMTGGAVKG